jgi:hypothetical protein
LNWPVEKKQPVDVLNGLTASVPLTAQEQIAARKARALWCVISAVILQCGLLYYLPTQPESVLRSIAAIGLSLLTGGGALFAPAKRLRGEPGFLLFAVYLACLTSLPSRSNTVVKLLGGDPPAWRPHALYGLTIAGPGAAAWRGGSRTWTVLLLVLAAIFVYRSAYAVRHVNETEFDVFYFHHETYRKFMAGRNPYSPPMPLYVDADTARKIYPPEKLTANSIQTGYQYPPIVFSLGYPSFAISGDFRYTGVAALLLIAFCLTRFSPDRNGWLAAAIVLTNPYMVTVVSLGWPELDISLLLFLFLLCWRRWPAHSAWLFGLFIGSKPTIVVWVPLGLLLAARQFPRWRDRFTWLGKNAVTAIVPILPFVVLWPLREFYESVLYFHALTPFRADSLSIGPFLQNIVPAARWLSVLLGVSVFCTLLGLAVRHGLHKSLPAWVAAYAWAWTGFLLFNQQSFSNYYCLSILGWIAAAVLMCTPQPQADGSKCALT